MSAPQLPSPAPSPFPGGSSQLPSGYNNAEMGTIVGLGTAGAADGAVPDQSRIRTELETQLLRLSQDLYEMEICAGEVGTGMEDAVPGYLSKINQTFARLSDLSSSFTDSVPRTIVDHVDRYKNPHQYTKTALSRATGENQYALGRVLGLESFRRQLHDAVSEAFPGVSLPERRHKPITEDESGLVKSNLEVNGDVLLPPDADGIVGLSNGQTVPQSTVESLASAQTDDMMSIDMAHAVDVSVDGHVSLHQSSTVQHDSIELPLAQH